MRSRLHLRAGNVLVDDARDRRWRALKRRALHVVEHAPHATHLLTATRAARATVHQMRHRRAVTRRLLGALSIHEHQSPVMRRCAEDDLFRNRVVRGEERPDERALPALGELDGVVDGLVRHDRIHRTERFDVVRRLAREGILRVEQEGWKKSTADAIGTDHVEIIGISDTRAPSDARSRRRSCAPHAPARAPRADPFARPRRPDRLLLHLRDA